MIESWHNLPLCSSPIPQKWDIMGRQENTAGGRKSLNFCDLCEGFKDTVSIIQP